MEEKIIIKSEKLNVTTFCIVLAVIGLILALMYSVNYSLFKGFNDYYWTSILPYSLGILFLPLAGVALLIYMMAALTEITVTDKRVYGKAMFGKRVDLPLDSISAVGTSLFKGIGISTASGRISFLGVKNSNELHSAISKLLMERQNKNIIVGVNSNTSSADELKKYKELLDNGIITQAEFDAKKKELLGF